MEQKRGKKALGKSLGAGRREFESRHSDYDRRYQNL